MKNTLAMMIITGTILFFSGCGGGCEDCSNSNFVPPSKKNEGIAVPVTPLNKERFICIDKMKIGDREYAAKCNKLLIEDSITENNGEIFGLLKDFDDRPILLNSKPYICNGKKNIIGEGLEYSSIIRQNNKLYLISQFDCAIGAIYLNELEQTSNGRLSVKPNSMRFISQRDEFGGYRHKSGSITPWQSYLGSEGFAPDAYIVEQKSNRTDLEVIDGIVKDIYYEQTALYWGGDITKSNPYFYGWANEIIIDANEVPHFRKHYSMGRYSHHGAIVMPDRKTVYLTDNSQNGALFMFIADKKDDLSAGTLYAPKESVSQDLNQTFIKFNWINLGHTSNRTMKLEISKKINFSDLFAISPGNSDMECPSDFIPFVGSLGFECLKKKNSISETVLSRLETKRYSALKGADFNFINPKGLTYDSERNRIYIAAQGYGNKIFKYSSCGAIYATDMTDTKIDTDGELIKSNFIADKLYLLIEGKEKTYPKGNKYEDNECSVEYIANPDGLSYIDDKDILTISEDSGKHINPMIWNYDLKNHKLTRLISHPLEANSVSMNWQRDINGFDYLIYGVQHPLRDNEDVNIEEKNSYLGYWGPVKIIKTIQ